MSLNLRLLAPAFLLVLACTPKAEDTNDEGDLSSGGDETNGGSSDTEPVTSSDGDPSMPGTATNGTATTTPGSDSDPVTTTTPGTSVGTLPDPTGSDEATSATTVGTDSDSDTDDTSDPPPPVPCEGDPEPIVAETIMAYTQAQIPPDPDPTNASITVSSTTNGEPTPSDTLFIKFSDQQFTCADPNAILECGPHWEFTIVIAPEFQFPGLYNLAGNGPFATVSETSEGMNNDCAGAGGGGGFNGTFELINITDVTVEGRLCGIDALFTFSEPDLNGSFVAARCE